MLLKLRMELIPRPLWERNLRTQLGPWEWRVLRLDRLQRANSACEVCGLKEGKLFCHEQWEYDDTLHTQRLVGLIITCFMCNLVNHRGMADAIGVVSPSDIRVHFLKVNNCTKAEYQEHMKEAFSKWGKRSMQEWTQDTTWLETAYPRSFLKVRAEVLKSMESDSRRKLNSLFKLALQAQNEGKELVLITAKEEDTCQREIQ